MVLNEKSCELMVVNGVTGDILGHHSIPLFKKEDLSMAYLVVCADNDVDGEQGQYLVDFSDIIYINEQHAIAVRACIGDEQLEELSQDAYTELIGLPVRYDDGESLGRLTEIQYNSETGELDMAVADSETKTIELLHRQIESVDNFEVVIKRKLETPAEKMQPGRVWLRRPFVEEPALEEPAVEEPILEAPILETPVLEDPILEMPILEEPIVEAPVLEEPIVEAPVLEEPILETPILEEPVINFEPVREAPAVEEPAPAPAEQKETDVVDSLDSLLREMEAPVTEEPAEVKWPELDETFAAEPEQSPVEAVASEAERIAEETEQIPLYEQKFAGMEEEEPAEPEQPEQPKKNEKKEKTGRSLWKRGN